MNNPKSLWENTYMSERAYPIQYFLNQVKANKAGECILYLHWHEHMEIIIMRTGHAIFYIDSQPIELKSGHIAIVPGGSLHVGYALDAGEVSFDCIVFSKALFHEWIDDHLHIKLLTRYLEGVEYLPFHLNSQPYYSEQSLQELNSIIKELIHKEIGYQLVVKANLYAWLVKLARLNNKQKTHDVHEVYFANRENFKRLFEWVKLNYAEKPKVKEAASMVGLDPFYFCKQFKKLTGRTFIEYVNIIRTLKAEEMLKQGEETIGEIALKIGCENAAYFTKMYKQYSGMTPSETRRLHRKSTTE